jgi:hypothetical protein
MIRVLGKSAASGAGDADTGRVEIGMVQWSSVHRRSGERAVLSHAENRRQRRSIVM